MEDDEKDEDNEANVGEIAARKACFSLRSSSSSSKATQEQCSCNRTRIV